MSGGDLINAAISTEELEVSATITTEEPEISADVTTEEPEIAATLSELRYLVFRGLKGDTGDSAAAENAVLYTTQSLSDSQKAQARTNVGAGTYSKPSGGIPASDLASGVIPDISGKVDKIANFGLAKIADNGGNYSLSVREGENSAINAQVVSVSTFNTSVQTVQAAFGNYYTKTEIDGKLTNAYVYKGSVATVSDLPSSDVGSGWVYNVEASGMNYAWNGSAWDALGETFSITAINNAEIDTICT